MTGPAADGIQLLRMALRAEPDVFVVR